MQNVLRKTLFGVPVLRRGRGSVSSTRNAIHVAEAGQLRGEVIEYVRCVPGPCQQHKVSPGTAPIEHLHTYPLVHRDELHYMARRVTPNVGGLTRSGAINAQNQHERPCNAEGSRK